MVALRRQTKKLSTLGAAFSRSPVSPKTTMSNTTAAASALACPKEGIAPLVQSTPHITQPSKFGLPDLTLEMADSPEDSCTRRGVLHAKHVLGEHRTQAFRDVKGMPQCPEKQALYRAIQDCTSEEHMLERRLHDDFVPQHGTEQFLSPRVFFESPLFRVASKSAKRLTHIDLVLPTAPGRPPISYAGPELRQSDGLVFLALVHMLRDVRVGTAVSLPPDGVCRALFGRYDGNSRCALREHIQRLQQGLIRFESFSVQLCLGFDYPKFGRWTVALDAHIIELFRVPRKSWLHMQPRLTLPDGLATWLYTYVETQTKLIPMQLSLLRELCGSQSSDKAFENRMRDALRHLSTQGNIDSGWSIRKGKVHWRKTQ